MDSQRVILTNQLMTLRKNWKRQDFVESYSDEWDEIPKSLKECHTMMEEYIHHTYDIDLIKDCIENEILTN